MIPRMRNGGGGGLVHNSHPWFRPSIHPIVGPPDPPGTVYSNVHMRVCIYRVSFFPQKLRVNPLLSGMRSLMDHKAGPN